MSLATALWSASGYVGAFMRASNIIYETPEGRPIWKLRPLQVLVTLVMLLLIALSAAAIVVTGPVAQKVGEAVGLGGTATTIFDIVKWPIILLIVSFIISLVGVFPPAT